MNPCTCNKVSCPPCAARRWAQGLLAKPYVIIDTETTGCGHQAEVIQIGIVDGKGEPVYSTLIKPIVPIDERSQAFATHGITNRMVEHAPRFTDVYSVISFWMSGSIVVAYNSAFDRRMLAGACERHGLPMPESPWECAMQHYARFAGEVSASKKSYRSHKLEKACADMGVAVSPTHRAVADCLATWHLVQAMAK